MVEGTVVNQYLRWSGTAWVPTNQPATWPAPATTPAGQLLAYNINGFYNVDVASRISWDLTWQAIAMTNAVAVAGFAAPQAAVSRHGIVHLRGVIAASGSNGQLTLPAAARPSSTRIVPIIDSDTASAFSSSGRGPASVSYSYVTTSGVMYLRSSSRQYSLDGISFSL